MVSAPFFMPLIIRAMSRQGSLSGRNTVAYVTGVFQDATSKVLITLSCSILTSPMLVTVHGCGIAVRCLVNQNVQILTILSQLVQIITVNSCCL